MLVSHLDLAKRSVAVPHPIQLVATVSEVRHEAQLELELTCIPSPAHCRYYCILVLIKQVKFDCIPERYAGALSCKLFSCHLQTNSGVVECRSCLPRYQVEQLGIEWPATHQTR